MKESIFRKLTEVELPEFTGIRVLLMPFLMEDIETIPNDLKNYRSTIEKLVSISPVTKGVGYLTIDERFVKSGDTLRKKGLHVDGVGPNGEAGIWSAVASSGWIKSADPKGGKEKCWVNAAGIGGMITVSYPAGCRAWNKEFSGNVNIYGDCESLRSQFPDNEATIFEANTAYWCNSFCVHESLPMKEDCNRTFVRLSMPSDAPWYRGYTKNPRGVQPTGMIVPYKRTIEPEVILTDIKPEIKDSNRLYNLRRSCKDFEIRD